MENPTAVYYMISLNLAKHTYNVTLSFIAKQPKHTLKLPTWIPGSYMLREFSKNIIYLSAKQPLKPIIITQQLNKNTWQVSDLMVNIQVEVSYEVYAYDLGIRHAYLDNNRGYFNSSSLCLYVDDYSQVAHYIHLANLPVNWRIATGLPKIDKYYLANSYQHLIDCPFELGEFNLIEFKVKGVIHYIVLSGLVTPNIDYNRLISDVTKICNYQIDLFGGEAPFTNYTFMLYLAGEIFTGLEHSNTTALMAPLYAMPLKHQVGASADYIKLLGLISHEYFHSWNVKRIKPQAFAPYDLECENYTGLLWWFEGITSYYDDLVLYRCGLISKQQYLTIITDNINKVYQYDGVNWQSLVNSSITSWVKYYRPDENSPNSNVSYYIKGALVGLCLDLLIRHKTANTYSLDNVLYGLFAKYKQDGLAIAEDELANLISHYANVNITKDIYIYTNTTELLPLERLLAYVGLELSITSVPSPLITGKYLNGEKVCDLANNDKVALNEVSLSCKVVRLAIGYKVIHVYNNSLASEIGLAHNDVLIALNYVELTDIEKQFATLMPNDSFCLSLLRNGRLIETKAIAKPKQFNAYNLYLKDPNKLELWL